MPLVCKLVTLYRDDSQYIELIFVGRFVLALQLASESIVLCLSATQQRSMLSNRF